MAQGYARKAFAELLRHKREQITLDGMQERTGLSRNLLLKWMGDHQSPHRNRMPQICLQLGIDPDLLKLDDVRFQNVWRQQHLTLGIVARRYHEMYRNKQMFEAVLMINLAGMLLLKELSQLGYPMQLITNDVGQVRLLPIPGDSVMRDLVWKVQGTEEDGLQMLVCSSKTDRQLVQALTTTLENVLTLVEGCKKLQQLKSV